ncbi:protein S40-7-like [Actinidia eriantha]|uniref:protein S40-7-like n=1 Tax=Actinidia eriantha TaxID=165200 RepID=UPI00258C3FE1|nr:protein S40-7-like [Actinidia eriantha]
MEPNGAISFRHRRSPSSDRFLEVFSPPKSASASGGAASFTGDELNEDEVFWNGNFSEPKRRSTSPSSVSVGHQNHSRHSFRQPEKSGILAALAENPNRPVVYRKPTTAVTSSSRLFPAIPNPPLQEREREHSQSVPARKFHQSAPISVPVVPRKVRNGELADVDDGDEMLPPHEIVSRGSAILPKTTFSVLEGVGRTLKGRDLRQVRNAVWRKTGHGAASACRQYVNIV